MISNPGRRSGQHIVHRIVSLVDGLQQKEFTVELHGLPAHIEIRGNESAERAAKEATKWRLRKIRWGRTAPAAGFAKQLVSVNKKTS